MRPMTKSMKLTMFALAASAVAASSPAAAADYYLTLGDVKSASTGGKVREAAARAAAGKQIEIMSWSFGATRKGWDGSIKGRAAAAPGGVPVATRKGWDGSIKGRAAAAPGGVPVAGDVNGDGRADAIVPAGDVDGDGHADRAMGSPGAAASAMASGKRAHQPVGRGSVTLVGKIPACTVGAAYKDAKLQVAGVRYTLEDLLITGCAATSGGSSGEPAQSISLSYAKITLDY